MVAVIVGSVGSGCGPATKPYRRSAMTAAAGKWPAGATAKSQAQAGHLPAALTPLAGTPLTIPLAKTAAALRRIRFSSSSRFSSRLSRSISASSALRAAGASAEPAAGNSAGPVLSRPMLDPNSVATSAGPRPPSGNRVTACALNAAVNRRRVRFSAVSPS